MLHYKKYKDYEEYKKNQVEKAKIRGQYIRLKSERKYKDFLKHFDRFRDFLEIGSRVLCLGARFGEEVRAFRGLNYNAIGLDLLAEESDLVLQGDWNNMPFSKGIFNAVYTNSIDHCYDLGREISEIDRVLYKKGLVIIDLSNQHCAGSNDNIIKKKFADPERYEAMLWNDDDDVIKPFLLWGFGIKMAWLERSWNTYLLERNNGKNV